MIYRQDSFTFKEAHKEAMRVLKTAGVTYGPRKLASYSQALTYFILIEKEVEETGNEKTG